MKKEEEIKQRIKKIDLEIRDAKSFKLNALKLEKLALEWVLL